MSLKNLPATQNTPPNPTFLSIRGNSRSLFVSRHLPLVPLLRKKIIEEGCAACSKMNRCKLVDAATAAAEAEEARARARERQRIKDRIPVGLSRELRCLDLCALVAAGPS